MCSISTPQGSFDDNMNGTVRLGNWRQGLPCLIILSLDNIMSMVSLENRPRRSTRTAHNIQDEVADYCMQEESVSWQETYA